MRKYWFFKEQKPKIYNLIDTFVIYMVMENKEDYIFLKNLKNNPIKTLKKYFRPKRRDFLIDIVEFKHSTNRLIICCDCDTRHYWDFIGGDSYIYDSMLELVLSELLGFNNDNYEIKHSVGGFDYGVNHSITIYKKYLTKPPIYTKYISFNKKY